MNTNFFSVQSNPLRSTLLSLSLSTVGLLVLGSVGYAGAATAADASACKQVRIVHFGHPSKGYDQVITGEARAASAPPRLSRRNVTVTHMCPARKA